MSARTKWLRIGCALLLLVAIGIGWNWSTIRAKYSARQLRAAESFEARYEIAKSILAHGSTAMAACLKEADENTGPALAKAITDHANDAAFGRDILQPTASYTDAGQVAALSTIPAFLKSDSPELREVCRNALQQSLKGTPEVRAMAASLSGRPSLQLLPTVLPLLNDPEPMVRVAVLKAIGTAGDSANFADEELFRWLNDTDESVRTMCEAVLVTRGRGVDEIDLGRQLTHPNPRVRLQLLVDLAGDPQRDIGPWLERLSRDREPAVRAGSVRVAYERKLLYTEWADKLAATDPDATVRQVATYHRRRASGLTTVGGYGP